AEVQGVRTVIHRITATMASQFMKNLKEEVTCPVCLNLSYQFSNLRPNRNVANIVERLKMFKPSPEEEQKVFNCARHGKKLQLFCRKDMMAICWLCERSQEHRGHKTALIEEVAQEYKEQLQVVLQRMMADKKKFENWKDDFRRIELMGA
ncbi:mCG129233, partial [Mus musculus]